MHSMIASRVCGRCTAASAHGTTKSAQPTALISRRAQKNHRRVGRQPNPAIDKLLSECNSGPGSSPRMAGCCRKASLLGRIRPNFVKNSGGIYRLNNRKLSARAKFLPVRGDAAAPIACCQRRICWNYGTSAPVGIYSAHLSAGACRAPGQFSKTIRGFSWQEI